MGYRRWDLTQEGDGNEMSAEIFDPSITPDLFALRFRSRAPICGAKNRLLSEIPIILIRLGRFRPVSRLTIHPSVPYSLSPFPGGIGVPPV